jgi:uncharacterized membrane protein
MTALSLIFTLAALGISETVYLIRKRIAMERPICPIGGDCGVVLTSKYNHLLGVPNDILGLLNYIAIALISIFLFLGIFTQLPLVLFLKILVAVSCLMSVALIHIQWKILKAWCFWCLMSAGTVFAMGAILLIVKI